MAPRKNPSVIPFVCQSKMGCSIKIEPAKECVVGEKHYKIGDSFKQDCNSCSCAEMGAVCTSMACVIQNNPDKCIPPR